MSTSFAADLLPLFRSIDIKCMKPQDILLSDYTWMSDPAGTADYPDHANARLVHERIADRTMPPDEAWSVEKVAVFDQWMADGFAP